MRCSSIHRCKCGAAAVLMARTGTVASQLCIGRHLLQLLARLGVSLLRRDPDGDGGDVRVPGEGPHHAPRHLERG